MLRAGGFTLSALDAVRRTALALGDNGIFPAGAEFRAALFPVGDIEDFRNRNAHGTALGAVIRNSLQLILTTSHTFHFISSCCIWNRLRAFDFEVFIDIVHVLYWF